MIKVAVELDGEKYIVDINFNGESDIFDSNGKRINEEITTGNYYRILVKAKGDEKVWNQLNKEFQN